MAFITGARALREYQDLDGAEALKEIKRLEYEQDFYKFFKAGWKHIDPSTFVGGAPLQAVAEHLEAVADGQIKRLIINIPPRMSKSSMTSVAFPAWVWTQRNESPTSGAGVQFLHASYAQTLSLRDSVKCRRLISSDWYQKYWGDRFLLMGDQNTKTRFDNTRSGSRLSTSVGSTLTGEGGNCFPAGTMVSTFNGLRPIESLKIDDTVLSFNHLTSKVVTSKVKALKSQTKDDLYEICTTEGYRFTCTSDHPVFVEGRGYIGASRLGKNDRVIVQGWQKNNFESSMRQLRASGSETINGYSESIETKQRRCLLLESLLFGSPFDQTIKTLRRVWRSFSKSTYEILFGGMSTHRPNETAKNKKLSAMSKFLLWLDNVLFVEMCKFDSFGSNDRKNQFQFQPTWKIFESVSSNGGNYSGKRFALLCSMQFAGSQNKSFEQSSQIDFASSSSGREYEKQSAREFDYSLHVLPQEASCWHFNSISSVTPIGGKPQRVYDIQIEKENNFFANGILVHNCIIVDDPNAAQEAFSEATIQTTIDWWDTALSTRLNDPKSGAFIVIQQRLAEDDLTGHILSKDVGEWTHLMLPMKYEWRRHSVTSIGWEDWRGLDEDGNSLVYIMGDGERIPINEKARLILENEREGSLLMPDRFGEKEVKSLEAALGPFAAAGQLQQTPQIKGGGIIKRDWWQPWGETFPGFDYIIASLDTAYTTKEENDMSALSIWGVFTEDSIAQATKALSPDGRMYSVDRMVSKLSPKVMLINAWQGRMEINDLVVKVATMCKASQVDMLMIENKASGISVSQEMRRLYSNENFSVQLHDPKSIDKMSRLYAVQHLFAEGLIYAPNRSWADMVINECAIFPKGKHDDIVDTVSQALNYLRQTGILQRPEEIQNDIETDLRHTSMKAAPLYNA